MIRKIEIDPHSGFCFGVVKAVSAAEETLRTQKQIYSLGEIVHNSTEVDRLSDLGMLPVSNDDMEQLKSGTILFRAHGEPPSSYKKAKKLNLQVVDATCPVVLKLQERVAKSYIELKKNNGQIVIFGKHGHPEVIGLLGQVNGDAIVIENKAELDLIDFTRPIELYSQTTKDVTEFHDLVDAISNRISDPALFKSHDTICRQVSNRVPWIQDFAKKHQIVVFVGGAKSSNAKVLYKACLKANEKSYFVADEKDLNPNWFQDAYSIGICGATSTPLWQLEQIRDVIQNIN